MIDKRILFISFSYLDGNGGGIYASRAYINAFASIFSSVTLLYPGKRGKSSCCIDTRVKAIPVYDDRTKIQKALGFLIGKIHRFVDISSEYFSNARFDIVVFNDSTCSYKLIDKFLSAGIKVITIHHNYQIEYVKGDYKFPLRLPMLFYTNVFEGEAARKSHLNLVLTHQDAKLISDHYKSDRPFANIGVFEYSPRSYNSCISDKSADCTFVITGGLGDLQTENSIIEWIDRYYPILKNKVPSAKVIIAGKNPSEHLSSYILNHGIELVPSPNDMNIILDKGDYYICPIDRGGGLKLRNMDGFKKGLLVLSHKVSSRGYEVMEEQNCMYSYDDEVSFDNSLKKMLESKKTRKDILDCYNKVFSFESGVNRINNILSNWVGTI